MALLDRFDKQPDEVKIYQIDYSQWLASGETVSSVTPTVELLNPESGDVGEPTLTVGTTQILSGNTYEYFMSSGTDGKNYKVTFLASTSLAQVQESEIEFKVRDT